MNLVQRALAFKEIRRRLRIITAQVDVMINELKQIRVELISLTGVAEPPTPPPTEEPPK
ncbi:MAG TPA: hypothetical protein VGI65_00705 [Steroidobacteraceae bacterium]|jgi:hypothetical protein